TNTGLILGTVIHVAGPPETSSYALDVSEEIHVRDEDPKFTINVNGTVSATQLIIDSTSYRATVNIASSGHLSGALVADHPYEVVFFNVDPAATVAGPITVVNDLHTVTISGNGSQNPANGFIYLQANAVATSISGGTVNGIITSATNPAVPSNLSTTIDVV